jgi:hypothetical protein
MSKIAHNLNIQSYSLDEVLELFELTTYDISTNDLKRAKKKVLMLHPDKSRLDPKYFLFYKKAFDIILQFYDNQNRHNAPVDEKQLVYTANDKNEHNKSTINSISQTVKAIPTSDFQDKFNHLFESNNMGNIPDSSRNEWFAQEQSSFNTPTGKMSNNDMGNAFNNIKQQVNGLVKYNGVQDMIHTSSAGNSALYDDDDSYISCDPFGKLQYDDLRKVHRDQTVLSVSENDFSNVKTYNSIEEYNNARSQHSHNPLEKGIATNMLQEEERIMRQRMMKKEYNSKIQSEQYVEKNKTILSSFLQLNNGKF